MSKTSSLNLALRFLLLSELILFAYIPLNGQSNGRNRFHDPVQRKIAEWADQHEIDSLSKACFYPKAQHRMEAALALASVQDQSGVYALTQLLSDQNDSVVCASLYALGQCADTSCLSSMISHCQDANPRVVGTALEAIGKIAATCLVRTPSRDSAMEALLQHVPDELDTQEGWSKAVLWIHLAGITDTALLNQAIHQLARVDPACRFTLATSIGRYRGDWSLVDPDAIAALFHWADAEHDASCIAVLLPALTKADPTLASAIIVRALASPHTDHILVLASLRNSAKIKSVPSETIALWLKSDHPTIVTEALRALAKKDSRTFRKQVDELSTSSIPSISAAAWAIITSQDSTDHAEALMDYIQNLEDEYLQSELIRNIEMSLPWIPYLSSLAMSSEIPVIKTACVERMLAMTLDQNIDDFILQLIKDGDPGCIALAVPDLLNHPHNQFEQIITNLIEYSHQLKLPEDVEVLIEIQKLTQEPTVRDFNASHWMSMNRLDWEFILSIPEHQIVEIRTTSGIFTMQLDVNSAPGSVSSFLKLVDAGYFTNKAFHRMVTNFVVQGGCPRGDGFGSAPFILRSEFRNHRYTKGSVGLASAGKDTESCQWFVGLVPCINLEGRYTIFGQVVSGMDVVERLHVGSRILSMVRM